MIANSIMEEFVSFGNILSEESASIIMKYFRQSFGIETKNDKTPVTIADKESEQKIRKLISQQYPNHGIIGVLHHDPICVFGLESIRTLLNAFCSSNFFSNDIFVETSQ